jgi:putative ABC transport system permease protein
VSGFGTLSVAWRNLRAGKARAAFSIAGVAVATLLLLFVIGLYRGWNDDLVAYIEDTPADVWVVGVGADSFFTPSLVFRTAVFELDKVDGVETTSSVVGRPMRIQHGDDGWDSYVLGFREGQLGGPVEIVRGTGTLERNQIIIDEVLAKTSGLDVGDEVGVGLRTMQVVGVSRGGNLVLAQLSFVSHEDAEALVGLPGVVNFILLQTATGQEDAVVAAATESVPGIAAFTGDQFAANSQEVLERSVLPVLLVIVALAIVVGVVVVGLTVYTAVVEKEREFGILKAIGVPGPGLLRVVFEQSLICGLVGFVLGIGLTFLVSAVASSVVPQVVTKFAWTDIALVLGASLLMSLLAGFIPMQRVMRVDTLSVFKA